jgi:hypothetical protein
METVFSYRIQIVSIVGSIGFLMMIGRFILRGRLREEYAIIWVLCTLVLLLFSFWRRGIDIIAEALGVYYAPSLLFLGAIFALVAFLVHLSVVSSKLQKQNTILAREIALLHQRIEGLQRSR